MLTLVSIEVFSYSFSLNTQKQQLDEEDESEETENISHGGDMCNQVPCVEVMNKFLNTVDLPSIGEAQNYFLLV